MAEHIADVWQRLYDQKRYQEALAVIDEIIGLPPHMWTSWVNKGATLAALQRPLEAADAYLKGSKLNEERKGLFLACYTLVKAGEHGRLLEVFSAECSEDASMITLFTGTEEFQAVFQLPEFKALAAKYAGH